MGRSNSQQGRETQAKTKQDKAEVVSKNESIKSFKRRSEIPNPRDIKTERVKEDSLWV